VAEGWADLKARPIEALAVASGADGAAPKALRVIGEAHSEEVAPDRHASSATAGLKVWAAEDFAEVAVVVSEEAGAAASEEAVVPEAAAGGGGDGSKRKS
jgi:hypothetical protein